jgi:hypothetical protein
MTARDEREVHLKIIEKIGNQDGLCIPLGVLGSMRNRVPSDALSSLPDKIISAWQKQDTDTVEDWIRLLQPFYPNITDEQIGFRSSRDDCFTQILEYAYHNKCPLLFIIPSHTEAGHAVSINFIHSKLEKGLIAEMVYGLKNERPLIDVSNRKVIRDLDNIASDFLSNENVLVVLPPENQMQFN